MDLFNTLPIHETNMLPYDGEVYYYGKIFSAQEADQYFQSLMASIDWKNDEANIFGKIIVTKRKVAWYADQSFSYTYSKITKTALPWTDELKVLKEAIERHSGESYNSCLLNLYHDGSEGMAWHSDGEKDLKKNGAIASVTFGAERKFAFKHKSTNTIVSQLLHHGSLLVMTGTTQEHWLHRLPPVRNVIRPRINLTFRTITSQSQQSFD